MTILNPQTLVNFLDLIADGAFVSEASAAIGCAPKSKTVFGWLKNSETAGEFDPPPDAASPWCVTWRDKPDWLHVHYRTAVADGRAVRAMRSPIRADLEDRLAARANLPVRPSSSLRADLEERLAAKREGRAIVQPPPVPRIAMPPTALDAPPSPPPKVVRARPSYAFRAPALDTTNASGPPSEGRFSVVADRPKSKRELQSGLPEVTDLGVRIN